MLYCPPKLLIYPLTMAHQFTEPPEDLPDEPDDNRPGLGATLLLWLLIVALLATLIWPLWWRWLAATHAPPTPTPSFLQRA